VDSDQFLSRFDGATGAPSGIHGAFDITTNTAGQVTAEHFSSSCH
jgi:hypothetical protein